MVQFRPSVFKPVYQPQLNSHLEASIRGQKHGWHPGCHRQATRLVPGQTRVVLIKLPRCGEVEKKWRKNNQVSKEATINN